MDEMNDSANSAESIPAPDEKNDSATVAGSFGSPCPKCGSRPRRQRGGYCQSCDSVLARERRALRRSSSTFLSKERKCRRAPTKQCELCGKPLPHRKGKGSKGCPERARQSSIRRGRQVLNAQWPDYGTVLHDEAVLARAGKDWPHVRLPRPSHVFIGLDAGFDDRLIREHRDKDVELCRAMAALSKGDQREFFELYCIDPADAQHWAALPRWKRPIRKGDADDVLIWKFFVMQRLNMEQAARDEPPWALASQGAQLPQMFGALARLSPAGLQRLCRVMSTYGDFLQHHRDLGDVVHPPWSDGKNRGW